MAFHGERNSAMTITAYMPRGLLGYREVTFAPMPKWWDAALPVHYVNCPDTGPRLGFVRKVVHTIVIDLSKAETEILSEFGGSTRNEISRATREGTTMRVATGYDTFLKLYGGASKHKSLPTISPRYLQSLGESVVVTEAVFEGEVLVSHIYFVDTLSSRTRLQYSASLFRDFDPHSDKGMRRRVGRANRFLHYQDMLYFRSQGLRWFDLGGIILPDSNASAELLQVAEFKQSFGKTILSEANYLSWAQYLYRKVRQGMVVGWKDASAEKLGEAA